MSIVTVGLTDHDVLLALGVVPLGTTEWFGGYPGAIFPWAQDEVGYDIPEVVGDAATINFEEIAALHPDAILALYSALSEDQYELLTQIAPTVAQPADYVDYGIPWQELTAVFFLNIVPTSVCPLCLFGGTVDGHCRLRP